MNDIYAAVLCGGMSKRLGIDKAVLKFDGQILLDRTYNLLNVFTKNIRIIGNIRESSKISTAYFIPDKINGIGPLGGLYTALEYFKRPVLILSCDMPFIEKKHIEQLLDSHRGSGKTVIAKSEKGIEPLFGIYQYSLFSQIEQNIEKKIYALYHLFNHDNTKYVDFMKNSDIFFNINTLSDYKKALYLKKKNMQASCNFNQGGIDG